MDRSRELAEMFWGTLYDEQIHELPEQLILAALAFIMDVLVESPADRQADLINILKVNIKAALSVLPSVRALRTTNQKFPQ